MSNPFKISDGSFRVNEGAFTGVTIIDGFEDGNRNGWNVPGSTGSDEVVTPGLDGSGNKWRHNGFREAQLPGANAVDRGPQPGDVWEFWFHIESTSGTVINRVEFAADGINEPQKYRIEMEAATGSPEFQFEKLDGGTQVHNVTDAGVEFQADQTYSVRIEWRTNNSEIRVQAFEEPNHNPFSNVLSFTEPGPGSDYEQPGVYIFTNGNNVCYWDNFRILS